MSKFFDVSRRELRIWQRRPAYMIGSVFVMLFCSVFYLTFLGEGVPSDLPIGVVDNDNSTLTRNFIQQLDCTQLGKVVMYDDYQTARQDMQMGNITSICVLPQGMYEDVLSQRQPTVSFYCNTLYFLGGSLSYKDLLTMINLTSGAVSRQVLRLKGMDDQAIMGKLRPVNVDAHLIGNPTMNYGAYLANMMLPGMLQMVIIILTIYSMGTELKYGTSRHLLVTSGGKMATANGGKLFVYTILFTILGFGLMFLLYGWMHFPLAGSIGWMLLDIFLLVIASEAVAVFILGLFPVLRFALSIGGLYSVLSLSMAGFTLPSEAMSPFLQGFSAIFPLRHYYMMFVQAEIFGTGFQGCYPEIIHLLLFQIAPLTVIYRLKRAYLRLNYPRN